MALKDQTQCYRTFDGVRWANLCDVLDERDEQDVRAARNTGVRIRMRKHPEGYQQAFYHPDDEAKLTSALTQREGDGS